MAEMQPVTERTEPIMYYCWGELGSLDILNNVPTLTSAGVAWNNPGDGFSAHVPDSPLVMIDSGGFQSATWGEYPYSANDLHTWAESLNADIVAGMDTACERAEELEKADSIDNIPEHYEDRVERSLVDQIVQERDYRDGDYSFQFMPVIQGLTLDNYEWFCKAVKQSPLINYDYYGIGTVCKRAGVDEIMEVTDLVNSHFPDKDIHLFGATYNIYECEDMWGKFTSSDTAAWKWFAKSKADKPDMLRDYKKKVDSCRYMINNHENWDFY